MDYKEHPSKLRFEVKVAREYGGFGGSRDNPDKATVYAFCDSTYIDSRTVKNDSKVARRVAQAKEEMTAKYTENYLKAERIRSL